MAESEPSPLAAALSLDWYKPSDHPQDSEEALWMAHGIGGRYSIQGDLDKFIVWTAADEFSFKTFDSVEACKAWAEADWQRAVAKVLARPQPTAAHGLAEAVARKVSPSTWRSKDEGGSGYALECGLRESLNTAHRILTVQFGDTLCQSCGEANPVWHAPNNLWNSVMGDEGSVLCPSCFCNRVAALEAHRAAKETTDG